MAGERSHSPRTRIRAGAPKATWVPVRMRGEATIMTEGAEIVMTETTVRIKTQIKGGPEKRPGVPVVIAIIVTVTRVTVRIDGIVVWIVLINRLCSIVVSRNRGIGIWRNGAGWLGSRTGAPLLSLELTAPQQQSR